jgi:hypothetical protein
LTPAQLNDRKLLDLNKLETRLDEILEHYSIEWVDIYGGEVLLLPDVYLSALVALLKTKQVGGIGLNTNLSLIKDIVFDPAVHVSVSYDFEAREKHELVFANMAKLTNPFSVLLLGSPALLKKPAGEIITALNTFPNLVTVEVKPYSPNSANDLPVTYNQFENFVKDLIICDVPKRFSLTNETLIQEALTGLRNAYSDNHLYITPRGRYAVLEFDSQDREYFLEYTDLTKYFEWCAQEKAKVAVNSYCGSCEFKGRCLSEHLRDVTTLETGCNGGYHLLKWAEDRQRPKEWKIYQQVYNRLVSEHSDDFAKVEYIEAEELVENALHYFREATFPLIYPAKSYAAAIVYATLIEQTYGYPLRESLNDDDLFLGQDAYFVPYRKNPDAYEAILKRLETFPDWLTSGWAPRTAEYFRLECTEDGINEVNANLISQ